VSISPPLSPAAGFAIILRCLTQAVAAMSGGDRLTYRVIGLIADRIRVIKQRFARLAARLAAGTYRPRRFTPRRQPAQRRPRPPNPLPSHFGWLQPLVPEAVQFRAQLENLLRDPQMEALMAAAPASMARALRPLCWMLRLPPPPVLARSRPAAPPPEARPAAGTAPPAKAAESAALRPPTSPPCPPRARPLVRACGPPRPA
jgi:hypothetical protein